MRTCFGTLTFLAATIALSRAVTHDIAVGGLNADGTPHLAFTPPYISAVAGDTVRFTFNVKNHSVTQSSFQEPCSKLTNSYGSPIGFDSGFRPVAAGTANSDLPTFEITVNDTKPIWGYCMQVNPPGPTHCQSGMVFGINPPSSGNTFDKFLSMAKASGNSSASANATTTATEAQFTSTVVVFEEGATTTVTSSEFQFTSTVVVFEEGATTTITPHATSRAGKNALNLATSGSSDDSDSSKLLNTYAPATLGLLSGAVALLLAVLGVGIALLRRSSPRPSRSMALRRNSRYAQVPLHVPELGEYTGALKEVPELRYNDRGDYSDRV